MPVKGVEQASRDWVVVDRRETGARACCPAERARRASSARLVIRVGGGSAAQLFFVERDAERDSVDCNWVVRVERKTGREERAKKGRRGAAAQRDRRRREHSG